MNDQYRPEPDDTNPIAGTGSDSGSRPEGEAPRWSSEQPAQNSTQNPTQTPTPAEPTRTLPPMTAGPTAPAPVRRARGLSAAVLAGALVLGGAAGVGGAAWYDAWQGDEAAVSATTGSTNSTVAASNAAAPAQSVQAVAAKVLPSVVKINVTGQNGAGSGSGIILSDDGAILTNNHVVSMAADGGTITVNFNDGSTLPAKVVGTDPVTDIAVIKAEGAKGLTAAAIGSSDDLAVGQPVVAVGSPYGLNATVTSGIVSALNRPVSVTQETPEQPDNPFGFGFPQQEQQGLSTTYPAIQTDAAINPGNSGGPLVNMSGQVVGINSSIRTANGGASGSIGLGFAIPIDEVLPIVEQIRNGEAPTHARMAVTVSTAQGNRLAQGAVVRTVEQGGPADQAGLKSGDVITKVDGAVIDGSESLVATIRGHRPGDEVEITYLRGKDTKTVTVTLGSDEKTTAS
ncbi:MAG TPA: trypsin-like peptidase domain-containing protein [Marmoricola sp.]|nr:trypsin-like peptidase domain-containing protein [Marmoricola sp.]